MTKTQILKAKLKELDIIIPAFEEELDLKPGELSKDQWTEETIEHVYAELQAVFDVDIDGF